MAWKRPYKPDFSYGCRSQIWPEFENLQGILSPCFTTRIRKYWCFRLLGSFFPTSILKHFPSPRLMFCNTYNGILLFSRSSAHGKHNFGVHINKNTIKTNKNYTGEAKIPGKLSKTKPPKNTQFHTWRGMSNYHIKNRLFFLTMKIPSPALVDQ